MRTKTYGSTGKQVSILGFGGMRFDPERSIEENAELVRYAAGKGVNYFDTAPNYCQDQSEDIFALAFKDISNPFFVSTKGMPTTFDTAEKAYEAVSKSLERLGRDSIDFYHIWCLRNMSHYELAMRSGGQYEGLLKAKGEGLIKHIVCSSHMSGELIEGILKEGKVEGVLLGFNILNFPYRLAALKAAARLGKGIVVMNPLGGGIIPQNQDKLAFLKSGKDGAVARALEFCFSLPEITITLVGFSKKEHIDFACEVAERAQPLSESELQKIQENLNANMNAICTGCGYCKDCPQNIPVPAYLQFFNKQVMFEATEEEMLTQLKHDSSWGILVGPKTCAGECIACGKCQEACTQHLPIMERLQKINDWEQKIT